jgi:nucleoside-diphosphate-sugar epimerase
MLTDIEKCLILKYAYRKADSSYFLPYDEIIYLNHSCNANILDSGKGFDIVVRDISRGEEATYDYRSFSLPAGDGKVSFVDVRDIASVAATVLTKDDGEEHKDKAYDVTGPESLTYSDAANILSNEAGKKIGYSNISEDDARQMIKEMGMNDWHTNVLLELLKITREGYLSNISSAVEKVTGNKPISFHQFTKDYVEAFR